MSVKWEIANNLSRHTHSIHTRTIGRFINCSAIRDIVNRYKRTIVLRTIIYSISSISTRKKSLNVCSHGAHTYIRELFIELVRWIFNFYIILNFVWHSASQRECRYNFLLSKFDWLMCLWILLPKNDSLPRTTKFNHKKCNIQDETIDRNYRNYAHQRLFRIYSDWECMSFGKLQCSVHNLYPIFDEAKLCVLSIIPYHFPQSLAVNWVQITRALSCLNALTMCYFYLLVEQQPPLMRQRDDKFVVRS